MTTTRLSDAQMREILATARTIAVVGHSDDPSRTSYQIAQYLRRVGYKVYPVNPTVETIDGEISYPSLAAVPEPIDIVDVFRRPELIPTHVDDILAMSPKPRVVWFQLGIKHEEAAKKLEEAGILVVQNRCTLADHQRLGLGKPERR